MGLDGSVTTAARLRAAAVGGLGLAIAGAWPGAGSALGATPGGVEPEPASRSFITSDGARLHYLEAGPSWAQTVVFVPGWTMPGWIFDKQIAALSDRFHVIALDPRGQGESEVTRFGYAWERRGADVGDLIDHVASVSGADDPVVLVGWSLGVLDSLAYVSQSGDAKIAGLVLIDNSIGEPPAPTPGPDRPRSAAPPPEPSPDARRAMRATFVRGMFARDPGEGYRRRLTDQALRMTWADERRLLAYDTPRETWRDAVHSVRAPILYVIRPRWREQAASLLAARPNASVEVFDTAGHALFVDEAERFDAVLIDFLDHRVARRSVR